MKKLHLFLVLFILLINQTLAANNSAWKTFCAEGEHYCHSLWISTDIPNTNKSVLLAYNAKLVPNKLADANFVINLNNIQLAPEQNAVALMADQHIIALPVVAQDFMGITAQLSNLSAVNQVVTVITDAKRLSIHFMEKNAKTPTAVNIPLTDFNEQLKNLPHGDILFWKQPDY